MTTAPLIRSYAPVPAATIRTNTAPVWHPELPSELLDILVLCRTARSLTEVATLLGAPVGAVTVLVDDLVARNLVTVHDGVRAGRHRAAEPATCDSRIPG